jgi:hypothetical protein
MPVFINIKQTVKPVASGALNRMNDTNNIVYENVGPLADIPNQHTNPTLIYDVNDKQVIFFSFREIFYCPLCDSGKKKRQIHKFLVRGMVWNSGSL